MQYPMLAKLIAFIRLGRYHFLAGGFLLYGLGTLIAYHQGVVFQGQVFLVGQLIVTATQLMVHYSNDYFDQAADQANRTPTLWSGGSRVLQEHRLSPRLALITAQLLGLTALSATLWLLASGQLDLSGLALILTAIMLGWFYSAPPVRLHSRGLGEVSATLIVAVLAPLMGYYLQAHRLSRLPILAILPLILLQFNMLLSVAVPDVEGDRQVNKRTLAVLWGRLATARLYIINLALVYVIQPVLVALGLPVLVTSAIACSLPMAAWALWLSRQNGWDRPTRWARLAFLSIALLISTVIFEMAAFAYLVITR